MSSRRGFPEPHRGGRGRLRVLAVTLVGAALGWYFLWGAAAEATSSIKSQFNQRYGTQGSRLDTCKTCHTTANDAEHLNPYGRDLASRNVDFAAVEPLDSDGDGAKNIDEINARTFPGDPSDKPGAAPSPTPPPSPSPAPWPVSQIPTLQDVLRYATSGLPILGPTFGGKGGGFLPAPYSEELALFVEWATRGTTESCIKEGCHPDKPGNPHYLNVTPNGSADCWVCHTKHVLCTTCHRIGAGESVGHVVDERVNAFTGLDVYPVTNSVDALIATWAPEVNYAVADAGLLLKDMPGDISGVVDVLLPILEGQGRNPRLEKTLYRADSMVHDARLYRRLGAVGPQATPSPEQGSASGAGSPGRGSSGGTSSSSSPASNPEASGLQGSGSRGASSSSSATNPASAGQAEKEVAQGGSGTRSPTGSYQVLVGPYSSREEAAHTGQALASKGLRTSLTQNEKGYFVSAGEPSTGEGSERLASDLRSEGFPAEAVPLQRGARLPWLPSLLGLGALVSAGAAAGWRLVARRARA